MANAKQKNPTVRVNAKTHEAVKQLAAEDHTSMAEVVAEAIKEYERKRFHDRANEIWRLKMQDSEERAFWGKEDAILEGTLMDGLDEDERAE